MKYNDNDNSPEIELNEILINIDDGKIKKYLRKKESKPKNIYIDNNIINKIFFIWNIKSTYFERSKNIEEYHFEYYPLINSKKSNNNINNENQFSFCSFYKTILSRNKFITFITIFVAVLSGIFDFLQYIFLKSLLSMINNNSSIDTSEYYIFMKIIYH